MLIDVAISGERNEIKKEAEILHYKDLNSRHTAYIECENKSDTRNKRGNWNHFKITQKKTEQHISTGKAQNQRTTENRHTGHCTHSTKSADVKVQNIQNGKYHCIEYK
jgi:hypothetical protein